MRTFPRWAFDIIRDERFLDQLTQRHGLATQGDASAGGIGELDQVVDQPVQPFRRAVNCFQRLALLRE